MIAIQSTLDRSTTRNNIFLAFMDPKPALDSPPAGQASGASAVADATPHVLPGVQSASSLGSTSLGGLSYEELA